MKKYVIIISLLALLIVFACCGRPSQPPTGENVIVQFRRDALGSAHGLPVSPTTGSRNGSDVCLSGELLSVNEEWIVLGNGRKEHWIPRDVVLLIEVEE